MKHTKDETAKSPAKPEAQILTVKLSVTATADNLTISDTAVARIQAVYDQYLEGCSDSVKENPDLLEDLKQETAVAVLEAMISMSDDNGNLPNQADIYKVVEEYLTGWLNAQGPLDDGDDGTYLSLQEIMQQMQWNTEEDEYHDLDDYCSRCDHCRKVVNIYNGNGVINIII